MTKTDRLLNSRSFEAVLDSLATFGNPRDSEYQELISQVSQKVSDLLEQQALPDLQTDGYHVLSENEAPLLFVASQLQRNIPCFEITAAIAQALLMKRPQQMLAANDYHALLGEIAETFNHFQQLNLPIIVIPTGLPDPNGFGGCIFSDLDFQGLKNALFLYLPLLPQEEGFQETCNFFALVALALSLKIPENHADAARKFSFGKGLKNLPAWLTSSVNTMLSNTVYFPRDLDSQLIDRTYQHQIYLKRFFSLTVNYTVRLKIENVLKQPRPDNRLHHPCENDKTFQRQNRAAITNYEQSQQKQRTWTPD